MLTGFQTVVQSSNVDELLELIEALCGTPVGLEGGWGSWIVLLSELVQAAQRPAAAHAQRRPVGLVQRAPLLALDVDGVLTDNRVTIHSDGSESKGYFIPDGAGIRRLLDSGIAVVWISGRPSQSTDLRAAELRITDLHTGVRDKGECLQEILEKLKISAEETIYVGDDLIDLPAFAVAGVSVAPADATPEVLAAADLITPQKGGYGAVRQVCDWILALSDRSS